MFSLTLEIILSHNVYLSHGLVNRRIIMAILDDYQFLRAAIEDISMVSAIESQRIGNSRHAVCLMHDAIEFILYEILNVAEKDFYKDGQNTVGLNEALKLYEELGNKLPLKGCIRNIQKFRGDAKHHAQLPTERDYRRVIAEFPIVISRLIYEQFGQSLRSSITQFSLMPYHEALYKSYRKRRTHNWRLALQFAIGALLHKSRSMCGVEDDYTAGKNDNTMEIVTLMEQEINMNKYSALSLETVKSLKNLIIELRQLITHNQFDQAAEKAGKQYSEIEEKKPTVFDIELAQKITPHLYRTETFVYENSMSWSPIQHEDGNEEQENYIHKLQELLQNNRKFIETFENPDMIDEDDDFFLWCFAIFDGTMWHSFLFKENGKLFLETGSLNSEEEDRRKTIPKLIYEEFLSAIEAFNNQQIQNESTKEEQNTQNASKEQDDSNSKRSHEERDKKQEIKGKEEEAESKEEE